MTARRRPAAVCGLGAGLSVIVATLVAGVTLFASDPAAIKDVVYELRFDEASARFAEFGPFTIGLICEPEHLP